MGRHCCHGATFTTTAVHDATSLVQTWIYLVSKGEVPGMHTGDPEKWPWQLLAQWRRHQGGKNSSQRDMAHFFKIFQSTWYIKCMNFHSTSGVCTWSHISLGVFIRLWVPLEGDCMKLGFLLRADYWCLGNTFDKYLGTETERVHKISTTNWEGNS